MDSTPRNPTPMRDEEVTLFKEVQGISDQFFKCLFTIIAVKNTNTGESFFRTHPTTMTPIVLAILVYFLAWLLATLLRFHVGNFLPVITSIIFTIGGIASVLALIILL